MDKREIVIRLVEPSSGLIINETRKKIVTNFWHQKDRNDLHAFLDIFIEKVRSSSPDASLCLDFVCDVPYVEGKLPF